MAGRGAAPKAAHQRQRDTRRRIEDKAIRVPDQSYDGPAPELPDGEWSTATIRWWDTWSHSPQAHMFTVTDWAFLVETAYIAEAFYTGNMSVASELRLRVAKFGATPEDRARLRLQFVPPDEDDKLSLAVVRPIKGNTLMDLSEE
jgi:hypothetical protein